jgi:hypothetical protein
VTFYEPVPNCVGNLMILGFEFPKSFFFHISEFDVLLDTDEFPRKFSQIVKFDSHPEH